MGDDYRDSFNVDNFENEPLQDNNHGGVDGMDFYKSVHGDTTTTTTAIASTKMMKKKKSSRKRPGQDGKKQHNISNGSIIGTTPAGDRRRGSSGSLSLLSTTSSCRTEPLVMLNGGSSRPPQPKQLKITIAPDELQALIESAVKKERQERELLFQRERQERKILLKRLEERDALWERERQEREEQIKALQAATAEMTQSSSSLQRPPNNMTPPTDSCTSDEENEEEEKELSALMIHHHDQNRDQLETSAERTSMERMEEDSKPHKKDHNNDEEWHAPFGETIYTFLYLCHYRTQEFWYSIVAYLIQMAAISLTLADAIDVEAKSNPLQIPPMVGVAVTYAQALVVLLLFAWQQDIIEGIVKFGERYYPLEGYPGATYLSWIGSCAAQLAAGFLVCFSCFILTMQASTVVGLMLNVTALLFMSEIDDVFYYVAKMGFITGKLQATAIAASEIQIPKCKTRNLHRRAVCFLTMGLLFVGYIILKGRQLSGHFVPTNIYVQFGDAYNPKIPYYSGILASGEKWRGDRREYRDMGTSNILLAYCREEQAWTFSEGTQGAPCQNYFAKSYQTATYDVASIPNSEWEVLDSHNRWEPFDSFALVERKCSPEACQGVCEANGLCICPNDQFGLDCQFSDVCQDIIIDERFPSYPQVMRPSITDQKKRLRYETFSDSFRMLKNNVTEEYVQVYSMPVYYSNSTFPANIMFFGGRRWILTTEDQLIDWEQAHKDNPGAWYFPEKTTAMFENGFHAHYGVNYTPAFISDPVDFQTPSFLPTPIGLHWWTIKTLDEDLQIFVPDIPVDTILLCDDPPPPCQDQPESFCVNGKCDEETGRCDCDAGSSWGFYYGDRCDLVKPCYDQLMPCYGGGNCDSISGECKCVSPWHGNACLSRYACYEEKGSCKNDGECNSKNGNCNCPVDPAITGRSCEKRASCEFFGCSNGGVCGYNGECVCRPPFYGAQCDLVNRTQESFFCLQDEDCMNGTCNLDTGFCDCQDPSAYGPHCEHTHNCSHSSISGQTSCLNSGVCNESSGVCDCPEPYFGPDCSQVAPCTSNKDCWGQGFEYANTYWGSCDVESGMCQCLYGKAAGMRCEKPILQACWEDQDCYGATSTCYKNVCQCETGLGGFRCESFIAGEYHERWDGLQQMLVESVEFCGYDDPACCSSNGTGFRELKVLFKCSGAP